MDPVVWALADARRCGGTFLVVPLPLFRTPEPGIDAQQPRSDQSRFCSHKTPRSRKKGCSSSSSSNSNSGGGRDPDTQDPEIDQAAGSNAVAASNSTFLPAPITDQAVCKLPQPGPTVTVPRVLVFLGFGCRSS